MAVLPLCAQSYADVQGAFASELLRRCPKLAVPLASQIKSVRSEAALHLIRQGTAVSFIASLEPLPLLDVSVLVGLQVHLLGRIGTLYGKSLSSQSQWPIVLTVAFGLGLRYVAQTALKFLPEVGWLISGIIGASGTWAVGQAALTFYGLDQVKQSRVKWLLAQVNHVLSQHRAG